MPTTFFGWVLFLMDKYGPVLLKGAGVTLLLAVVGTFIGCLIGLVVGVIQTIPMEDNDSAAKKWLRRLTATGVLQKDGASNAPVYLWRG